MVEQHYMEYGSDDDEDESMQIARTEQAQARKEKKKKPRKGLRVHLLGDARGIPEGTTWQLEEKPEHADMVVAIFDNAAEDEEMTTKYENAHKT